MDDYTSSVLGHDVHRVHRLMQTIWEATCLNRQSINVDWEAVAQSCDVEPAFTARECQSLWRYVAYGSDEWGRGYKEIKEEESTGMSLCSSDGANGNNNSNDNPFNSDSSTELRPNTGKGKGKESDTKAPTASQSATVSSSSSSSSSSLSSSQSSQSSSSPPGVFSCANYLTEEQADADSDIDVPISTYTSAYSKGLVIDEKAPSFKVKTRALKRVESDIWSRNDDLLLVSTMAQHGTLDWYREYNKLMSGNPIKASVVNHRISYIHNELHVGRYQKDACMLKLLSVSSGTIDKDLLKYVVSEEEPKKVRKKYTKKKGKKPKNESGKAAKDKTTEKTEKSQQKKKTRKKYTKKTKQSTGKKLKEGTNSHATKAAAAATTTTSTTTTTTTTTTTKVTVTESVPVISLSSSVSPPSSSPSESPSEPRSSESAQATSTEKESVPRAPAAPLSSSSVLVSAPEPASISTPSSLSPPTEPSSPPSLPSPLKAEGSARHLPSVLTSSPSPIPGSSPLPCANRSTSTQEDVSGKTHGGFAEQKEKENIVNRKRSLEETCCDESNLVKPTLDASNALAKKVAGAGTGVLRGAGANRDVHGVSGGMNGSAKKQKMAHHYSVIGATGEVCTNGKRAGQDQTHHNIDKCSNGSARKADDSTSVIMDTSNGENCPNIDNDDGNGNKNGNDNGAGADAGIVADVYRRNTQEKYRLPEMQEMQRRKIEEE